jgi:hypothetical protein
MTWGPVIGGAAGAALGAVGAALGWAAAGATAGCAGAGDCAGGTGGCAAAEYRAFSITSASAILESRRRKTALDIR